MKTLVLALARLTLFIASRIVPPSRRGEWLAEWSGESWHRLHQLHATGDLTLRSGWDVLRRCGGAFQHAVFVRREERVRGSSMVENAMQDIRYAARRLKQNPAFATLAIVIMSLGIGVNTAIFSIVDAVLLRPLPYESPENLVRIFTTEERSDRAGAVSYPDFLDYRRHTDLIEDAIVMTAAILNLSRDGTSEAVFGEYMSANFFDLVGLPLTMGRAFLPVDDEPGPAGIAVISYTSWQRRFGSDPEILGATVRLNGRPITIVGIGPKGFNGTFVGISSEFWLPWGTAVLVEPTQRASLENRSARGLFMLARVRPDVSIPELRTALTTTAQQLGEEYPQSNAKRGVVVMASNDVRLHPMLDAALYPMAGFLLAVVALVLLVACSNLANLLLVRATTRRREMAIRVALGARRGRLMVTLLAESALLGLLGGMGGVLLAHWTAKLIVAFKPPIPVPIAIDLRIDGTVLAYAIALSLITGLVFGLVPALRSSRPDLVPALKAESGATIDKHRFLSLRNVLVILQVSVSVVLLVAAGLFVRGLASAQRVSPGFETARIAIGTLDLGLADYDVERAAAFYRDLTSRLERDPNIERVGLTDRVPLGASLQTQTISIDGYDPGTDDGRFEVDFALADAGYFESMGIPVIRGRTFSDTDGRGAPAVGIVSRAMARAYWDREDVIGQTVRVGSGPLITVVGVANDTKVRTLGESARPLLYLSIQQRDTRFASVVMKTAIDPTGIPELFRREVRGMNPDIPVLESKTMEEHLAFTLFPARMGAALLSAFGVLALALACVGLYGVVAFTVAQRTREVGIRIALGAQRERVKRLVIGQGMVLVATGLVIGASIGTLALRPVAGMLIDVSSTDLVTFGSVALILSLVAFVASYLPARRAANVDPMVALRTE